jgi:hypothetical protein
MASAHESKQWWVAPVAFATHSVVGTGIFVVIFILVVGLNFGIHSLEGLRIDAWVLWLARGTEAVVATGDVALYLTFLWKTGRRAAIDF